MKKSVISPCIFNVMGMENYYWELFEDLIGTCQTCCCPAMYPPYKNMKENVEFLSPPDYYKQNLRIYICLNS